MAYSKTDAAKNLGISKSEFEKRAKAAGFSDTESYYKSIGGDSAPLIQQITQQIIDLDRQLDDLGSLGLTDEEKENFLQNAITQVQPYYDRKSAEINKGIQEGRVRSAEDILLFTRDIENEVRDTLSGLDLKKAETQEDFLRIVSQVTAGRDEDVAAKQMEWTQRMENLKADQIQRGVFSSGIGKTKRVETQTEQGLDVGKTMSSAQRTLETTEQNTSYTIEQIRLAREAAERDRVARIGAVGGDTAQQQAMGTLGINDLSQLESKTNIEAARATDARNISTYKPEALGSLEEDRLKAVESRKLELQDEELALRNQEYEKQRQKILADKAAAQSRLSTYGG